MSCVVPFCFLRGSIYFSSSLYNDLKEKIKKSMFLVVSNRENSGNKKETEYVKKKKTSVSPHFTLRWYTMSIKD